MPFPRIDLPQGTPDLLILRTLALAAQHGWAIAERGQQVSSVNDVLCIQQGSRPCEKLTLAVAQVLETA